MKQRLEIKWIFVKMIHKAAVRRTNITIVSQFLEILKQVKIILIEKANYLTTMT